MWRLANGGVWGLRSHVDSNVTLIKLQKQLADRSNAVTEMEARFLHLQEVRGAWLPATFHPFRFKVV